MARNAKPRKVYISVDFEGAACVVGIVGAATQPLGSGLECTSPVFLQAQRLVTAEANAAIRGALAAGAAEVIVDDAHGCGHNLLYEDLHPEAKVLIGTPRPSRFHLLDDSFAGLILLCYHPMAGVADGVLAHSYSSVSVHRMLLNGRPVGEIALDAALAGEKGVPVVFVSSDEAGCAEARACLGRDLVTVATKKGLGRNCALSLSPRKAQAMTEAGVKAAVRNARRCKPCRIAGPHVLERVYKWETQAEAAAREKGAERVDPYTVRWRGKTITDLLGR
ncbi:MAG: M55 family metallopeptidase [Planctomycetota bacterium]|nr:M55 family metallopeptidase [Planctomycetota bacterium]